MGKPLGNLDPSIRLGCRLIEGVVVFWVHKHASGHIAAPETAARGKRNQIHRSNTMTNVSIYFVFLSFCFLLLFLVVSPPRLLTLRTANRANKPRNDYPASGTSSTYEFAMSKLLVRIKSEEKTHSGTVNLVTEDRHIQNQNNTGSALFYI